MVGQSVANLIVNEIVLRLVLSVTTSVIWLFIILFLIKILRVKSANVKYALLTVPLIKGLLAVIKNIPVSSGFKQAHFRFYFQLPDLGNLVPSTWRDVADPVRGQHFLTSTSVSTVTLIIILALIFGLTIWRLIGTIRFIAMIKKAAALDRSEHPVFFRILDRLVAKAKIKIPRIISVESSGTPFTVGIRKPIIAVSMAMMEKLETAEIEAVLAHEISHITRKDHLFHWPIVILRDILFFNPISHILYPRIGFEKERACDQMVSRQMKPMILAKSLVKIAEIQSSQPPLHLVKRYAPQSFASQGGMFLKRRVKNLLEQGTPFRLHGLFRRALVIISVLTLVIVEFHIITKTGSYLLIIS